MSLKDDLIAAKALINTPEKWRKGGWGCRGRRCALGAFLDLGRNVLTVVDRRNPATKALLSATPSPFQSVVSFNDHPDTTHADIMALFDRAIAAAEASE